LPVYWLLLTVGISYNRNDFENLHITYILVLSRCKKVRKMETFCPPTVKFNS